MMSQMKHATPTTYNRKSAQLSMENEAEQSMRLRIVATSIAHNRIVSEIGLHRSALAISW